MFTTDKLLNCVQTCKALNMLASDAESVVGPRSYPRMERVAEGASFPYSDYKGILITRARFLLLMVMLVMHLLMRK